MIFFDTSVIVAASYSEHPQHLKCVGRLHSETDVACAAHTLAEVFATLTRLPLHPRIHPRIASEIVQRLAERFTVVSLTPEEYAQCIREVAYRGLIGGIVYDALLMACARKLEAEHILTFNLGHFRKLAPDLSARIATP